MAEEEKKEKEEKKDDVDENLLGDLESSMEDEDDSKKEFLLRDMEVGPAKEIETLAQEILDLFTKS